MVNIQKNDFIELEFIAKANGVVFDTNIKEEAEKVGMKEVAPLIIAVGRGMVIKGLDAALEGKEPGKKYSCKCQPEEAFGKRFPSMVKMIPMKAFLEQKIMPERGMQLNLDGMLAKVLSVSGGRVLVDFNNPLSGKVVEYDYTIKRKIDDTNDKVNAIQEFFFRQKFPFAVEEKKIIFSVDKNVGQFIKMFEKQFSDILDMQIEIKEVEEKKEEKKTEKKAETLGNK